MSIMLTDPKITAGTICDRCPAKARARAWSGPQELFFCGHHLTEVMTGLTRSAWNVSVFPLGTV